MSKVSFKREEKEEDGEEEKGWSCRVLISAREGGER